MNTFTARRASFPLVGIVLFCVLTVGCGALPESGVASFVNSTSTLTTTLTAVGRTAVADVATIHDGTDASIASAQALSDELKTAWAARLKLMEAMNRYAASLQALVDAGKTGQENALVLSDSLKTLVETAGAAFPGTPAAKLVIDAGARVYGEIAKAVAHHEIQKAVDLADPIVSGVATLIAADFENLQSIAIETQAQALTQVRLGSIHAQLNSIEEARTAAADAAFAAPSDTAKLAAFQSWSNLSGNLMNIPEYQQHRAKEDRVNSLFNAQSELLEQASLTTTAWANGHRELAIALRQKRTVSLTELTLLSKDLYDIYKEYRTARSKK